MSDRQWTIIPDSINYINRSYCIPRQVVIRSVVGRNAWVHSVDEGGRVNEYDTESIPSECVFETREEALDYYLDVIENENRLLRRLIEAVTPRDAD